LWLHGEKESPNSKLFDNKSQEPRKQINKGKIVDQSSTLGLTNIKEA